MDMSQYLTYLPTEQLLICRSCKYALQPNGVEKHLRDTHKAIPLKARQMLVVYSKNLLLCGPSIVTIPTEIVPRYHCLDLVNGFKCLTCGTLTTIKTRIPMEFSV